MDELFKQLMTLLCGNQPQGLLFGAMFLLLIQRLGVSLPNIKLPNLPLGPSIPTPTPNPALPILFPNADGSPRFPGLRKLLEGALAGGGLFLEDVPGSQLKALRGEIDALIAEKAEKVRGELKDLE